ncbi:MAG: hypothetical protein WBD31_23965, partial [Rubripirellula sp.]
NIDREYQRAFFSGPFRRASHFDAERSASLFSQVGFAAREVFLGTSFGRLRSEGFVLGDFVLGGVAKACFRRWMNGCEDNGFEDAGTLWGSCSRLATRTHGGQAYPV